MREVDGALLRSWPLPEPGDDADKEVRGRVLVVGGSTEVPGAVLLAGVAALRAGAGKLRLATSRGAAVALGVAVPEALVYALDEDSGGAVARSAADAVARAAADVDAVVIGPGMGEPETVSALVSAVATAERPAVVLDAGALLCLRDQPEVVEPLRGRLVLTPNAAEMEHLRSDGDVVRLADEFGAVASLKGPTTFTASAGGILYADRAGNAGLATSGSGDVLAGMCGGLLARGASPIQAAVWANHLHGLAGDRLASRLGRIGFLARELLDEIPSLLEEHA